MVDSLSFSVLCQNNILNIFLGPHPDQLGETVGMQACFNGPSGDDECQWLTSIQVKNCGNFYLYKLEDTPYCPLRYCSTSLR